MLVRLLVALLISMNTAVLGWWVLRVPAPTVESVSPPAAEAPPLVLLSEAESQAVTPVVAEPDAPPEPLSAQPRCYRLGPFTSPADARRAMESLQPVVEQMQVREASGDQLRGYRVFLPAFADRATALAMARELADKGVRDYYVVTAGDEQNTISLGLFRDLANAEKRREELRAQGVAASLEPRSEAVSQWWLDLRVGDVEDWRERLSSAEARRTLEVGCP